MAYNKIFYSKSLIIETENGVNESGNTVFKQKSYSNIKQTATDEQLCELANIIISTLSVATRNIYVKSMDILETLSE